MGKQWQLYILECKDGTLYTGITCDLSRRLEQHRMGKGAKYTRGRSPLTLCYAECCESHSYALQRELQIKKLSHQEKLWLCERYSKGDVKNAVFFRDDRND